ncbi:hypothetical protein BASA83_011933 [Batrachochytrium salamandrivorans]|nr:hypothetical protein BASA83_011933 [Batrachochytrium salamandrivorans]
MDQAIRIDNRIFERRQEQQYNPRSFRRNPLQISLFLAFTLNSNNSNMLITTVDLQHSNLLPQPLQLPLNKHRTSNDMDIDFCSSWPLTTAERQTERQVQQLKWKATALKFRETISADSNILVSALSSLRKLLLPGLFDSGPFRTLILSSWIVAPMIFMDSKLAAELQIPLLELSTPITLRLADGDSSSSLTHRTVPLQLHIGNHVETATSILASEPFHGKIYQLTRRKIKSLQEWIKDNLEKVLFETAVPSWRTLLLRQAKDKLRLCMDYRGLNKNTVKDRNPNRLSLNFFEPCPLARYSLPWTCEVLIISSHQGRRRVQNFFITKYGQFEFLVMPFGLANAPAQFQAHDELLVP